MAGRCAVTCNDPECEVYPIATKCFACGQYACRSCTAVVVRYYRYARKRICLDCQIDHAEGITLTSTRRK